MGDLLTIRLRDSHDLGGLMKSKLWRVLVVLSALGMFVLSAGAPKGYGF
jgi:hypothetical protein